MLDLKWNARLDKIRKARARPPGIAGSLVLQLFHFEKGSGFESALVAFDLETGAERWRSVIPHVANEPIVGRDGTAYVGSFEGAMYAFDVDGRTLWRTELGQCNMWMPAFAGPNRILVAETGGRSSRTWCLATDTGEILWSFENGGHSYAVAATDTRAFHATAVNGPNFGETTIKLFALAVESGRPIWTMSHGQYLFMPALIEDHVIVGGRGSVLVCRQVDGRIDAQLPLEADTAATTAIASDAGVMIVDDAETLPLCRLTRSRSFLRSTVVLEQTWTTRLPGKPVGRPVLLGGEIAIMSEGGAIHLFSGRDGSHLRSIENKGGPADGAGGLAMSGNIIAAGASRDLRLFRCAALSSP